MEEGKQTFIELLIGIGIMGIIFLLPGLLFRGGYLSYYFGLALGIIVAIVFATDMYFSVRNAVMMDEKSARNYTRKKTIYRLLLAIAVLLIAAYVPQIHILGVLIGALTLKFSAYLQPLTHKFYAKNK